MQKQLRSLLVIMTFLITPLFATITPSTPLLAAPAAQGVTSDTVIAVYETDLLPLTDELDLQYTLTFFDDGTVELVTDLSDDQGFLEYGEYEESDDGSIVVTLIGIEGEAADYAEPILISFIVAEDGALEGVEFDADLFGVDELILFPIEIAETEVTTDTGLEDEVDEADIDDADIDDTIDEDAAEAALDGPEGAYISAVLPDFNGGSEQFLTFVLHPDGTLIFTTYYLNGSMPVLEVGDWSVEDDGVVLLNATGTIDEEYDEPVAVPFDWDGATLTTSGVTFYRVPGMAEMEAAGGLLGIGTDDDELVDDLDDDEPGIVGYYESDLLPAASGPGLQYRLTLYEDGHLIFENDYQDGDVVVEDGFYDMDTATGSLMLFIMGSEEADYDDIIIIEFEQDEDGALVAVDFDEELFGEEGLILFPADAPLGQDADSESTIEEDLDAVVFSTTSLPDDSEIGKISFSFMADFRLIMVVTYADDSLRIEEGEWFYEGDDDFISIFFDESETGDYDLPIEILLTITDDGTLLAEDLDVDFFGVEELELAGEDEAL